jgi:hypothetical protein
MTALAPAAPGRPGQPVDPPAMLHFLTDLARWRDRRRAELDELDAAALESPERAALTGDMTLAMTLWQAVATRADELEQVWDSGRVGAAERQRLTSLLWGRLDASTGNGAGALAVSLPEACRLSDALVGQLRRRLALDPVDVDLGARLRTLRAALERVRDLVDDVPEGPLRERAATRLDGLDRRLSDLMARARRGADVGGLLGPLDADTAVTERDLIVAAATRADDARDRARAADLRSSLAARAAALEPVVAECVATVRPAPVLAVPRVEQLGPVPEDADAVDTYLDRLADVERAMDRVEHAYEEPLAELADLTELLGAYRAKAARTGLGERPEVVGLHDLVRALLTARPAELDRCRAGVAAFRTLVDAGPRTEVR